MMPPILLNGLNIFAKTGWKRRFIVAALWTAGFDATASEGLSIQNAGFESTSASIRCQSIPGWTLHGAQTTSISVVDDSGKPALKIANGKAFCYGLAIDPAVDYVLALRVRARDAKVHIETDPPLPVGQVVLEGEPTFDWKTVELRLPAAKRPEGVREAWIALGAEALKAGGSAWFRDVRLEPVAGGPNVVSNGSFLEPVAETTIPPGWILDSGGATITSDSNDAHEGAHSLKVTGLGQQFRLTQSIDLTSLSDRGVRRVRISGWGKSRNLGSDRVRLEVHGAMPPASPILSLSGNSAWTKGEAVLDLGRQRGRRLSIWIQAPRPFDGDAWFDDIRIEPVPDDEVVNLLANASFHPSLANEKLPDFWGLWGDAVWCIEPWSLEYFTIADEPGPFATARVIQVYHPPPGKYVPVVRNDRLNMFILTGSNLDLPDGDYTFSIYAKSDRPNTAVHIHHPATESPLVTASVGRSWQRIVATSRDVGLLPAIRIPDPGSRVWLSAPQLEPGKTATTFRPSAGHQSTGSRGAAGAPVGRRPRSSNRAAEAPPLPSPSLAVYAEYDHVLNDRVVRARLEWSGATPATIHWRLLDAVTGEKLPVEPQSMRFDEPGTRTFVIPAASLRPGLIGIQAIAEASGKKLGRATDVFAKLADSPRDVRVNRFGRSVVVDGNPFFPVFLPVEPATLGDWHMDRLVEAGFNCLVAAPGKLSQRDLTRGPVSPAQEAEIRHHLDRLHARGMKLVWPLPWSFKDWSTTAGLYGGEIAGLAETFQKVVATFRDHPAILGWYLMDEPSPREWEEEYGFRESDLHRLWFAVKEADQGRPAYINWNHTWALEPYGGLGCTDVVSHDNYVISGEPFDYRELVPSVRMVNDRRAGRKPAFAWISGSYDEVAQRPEVAAVRVHAWLHLIYGTRGLGYWSKPPLDPLVWAEMKSTNRNAASLHQLVLGHPQAELKSIDVHADSIHSALWVVADTAYLLAVNASESREVLCLDLAAACERDIVSGSLLFAEQEIRVDRGVVRDELEPFSRRVYRFALSSLR